MATFNFKRSVKATVWVDESIFIEADSYEEALEEARNNFSADDDRDEATVDWETYCPLSPSENGGNATLRIYDENWNLIEKNSN